MKSTLNGNNGSWTNSDDVKFGHHTAKENASFGYPEAQANFLQRNLARLFKATEVDSARHEEKKIKIKKKKEEKEAKKLEEVIVEEEAPHWVSIPAHYPCDSNYVPALSGFIINSDFEKIIKKFPPNAETKLHLFRGARTYILDNKVAYPETMYAYYCYNVFLCDLILTDTDRDYISKQAMCATKNLNLRHLVSRWDHITRRAGEECTIPDTYIQRPGVKVTCAEGATFDGDYYSFPESNLPRWYSTEMFDLPHSSLPFVVYDNTSNNKLKALKRIIGSRDSAQHELMLHTNQLNMLATFAPVINNDVLKSLNVKEKYYRETETYTNSWFGVEDQIDYVLYQGIEVKGDLYKEDFYRNFHIDYLIGRCNRFVVTALKDHVMGSAIWSYQEIYDSMCTMYDGIGARHLCANIKHIKRALRGSYVYGQWIQDPSNILTRRLNANVKRELAKFGKVPRLFVDYGAGCMANNEVPEFIKMCLDGHHNRNTGLELQVNIDYDLYICAKPQNGYMDYVFKLVDEAQNKNNFVQIIIYSDDSMYAGCLNGKKFNYNVDISSCDSGNRQAVFAAVGQMLYNFSPLASANLLKQCMLPIIVKDPNSDANLSIESDAPFEGSGTVLTTVLNHVASFLIGVSAIYSFQNFDEIEDGICCGANYVGHNVTVEVNATIHKSQFLKHSPVYDVNGVLCSMLNLGCILRKLGKVDGELTAIQLGLQGVEGLKIFNSMTWEEKMSHFVGGVILGLQHEPSTSIMVALRNRFPPPKNGNKINSHYIEFLSNAKNQNQNIIPNSELVARYDVSENDIDLFCHLISTLTIGSSIPCAFLDNVYRVDYGVC